MGNGYTQRAPFFGALGQAVGQPFRIGQPCHGPGAISFGTKGQQFLPAVHLNLFIGCAATIAAMPNQSRFKSWGKR